MQISTCAFLGGLINEYARPRLKSRKPQVTRRILFRARQGREAGLTRAGQSCATSGLAASGLARWLNSRLA
jgi:hypothetical protein